jgi:hypothetical protein
VPIVPREQRLHELQLVLAALRQAVQTAPAPQEPARLEAAKHDKERAVTRTPGKRTRVRILPDEP